MVAVDTVTKPGGSWNYHMGRGLHSKGLVSQLPVPPDTRRERLGGTEWTLSQQVAAWEEGHRVACRLTSAYPSFCPKHRTEGAGLSLPFSCP